MFRIHVGETRNSVTFILSPMDRQRPLLDVPSHVYLEFDPDDLEGTTPAVFSMSRWWIVVSMLAGMTYDQIRDEGGFFILRAPFRDEDAIPVPPNMQFLGVSDA